jgi:hypothetical protein
MTLFISQDTTYGSDVFSDLDSIVIQDPGLEHSDPNVNPMQITYSQNSSGVGQNRINSIVNTIQIPITGLLHRTYTSQQ